MNKTSKDVLWLALLIAIAFMGVVVVLYHTRAGPGLTSDSAIYLQGAQNLQVGRGFSRMAGDGSAAPIADFPPVFSMFLAVLSFGNTDLDHIIQVGRWLNAVLFGGNIFLASWLVRRYTGSWGATILAGGLLLTSSKFIRIHSWLITEGTFIFELLLAVLLLDQFFAKRKYGYLLAAGGILGFLTLTRYAGLVFVFAAMITLWFFQGDSRKKRFLSVAILGSISLALFGLWLGRNASLTGETIANRHFGWYGLESEILVRYIKEWIVRLVPPLFLLPTWLRLALAVAITGLFLVPFLWQERQTLLEPLNARRRSGIALPAFFLIAILLYWIELIANTAFLDASTTLHAIPRYLSPAWVCFVILSISAAHHVLTKCPGSLFSRIPAVLYGLVLLVSQTADLVSYLRYAEYGLMDMKNYLRQEQELLSQLSPSRLLISNNPERLYLLANRPSYQTPRPYSVYTRRVNSLYQQRLNEMRARLRDGAYLVIIDPAQEDSSYLADLTQHLEILSFTSRVQVYVWSSQSQP